MKKISILATIALASLFTIFTMGCRNANTNASQASRINTNTKYITQANIAYENPQKIYSTNYRKGVMLPAGTEVTVAAVSNRAIKFSGPNGQSYTILFMPKHSTLTMAQIFDQYFGVVSPFAKNAFTEEEINSIKKGVVEKGMSKAAVLVAYGYPPSHVTPDLKSNVWQYWPHRMRSIAITFDDAGKVQSVGQ